MIISKVTKIIRNWMFENVKIFDGDFLFQKQKASVSKQLVQLISLVLDDNTLSNEAEKCTQTEAINVNSQLVKSQLIQFISVRKKRRSSDNVSHLKASKPLFPVKICLQLEKKSLIKKPAHDGLSINYQCVRESQ